MDRPDDIIADDANNDIDNNIRNGSNANATSDPPSSGAKEVVDQALSELAIAIDAMDAELESNTNSDSKENNGSLNETNAQGGDDTISNEQSDDDHNLSEENDHDDDAPSVMDDENNNNIMEDDLDDDEDAKIIIIGGWLGSGPLAASDMWVLDISGGLERLRWFQPPTLGTPPGPCNMHSADFIPTRNEVYVFRGGNGREYLNDLHALDVQSYVWRKVQTHGTPPQQRANHSSALLDDRAGKSDLFVFGGWNGITSIYYQK